MNNCSPASRSFAGVSSVEHEEHYMRIESTHRTVRAITVLLALAGVIVAGGLETKAQAAGRCGLTLRSVKYYDSSGQCLRVRSGPGLQYDPPTGCVNSGTTGVIISGPTFADGYYWWYVQWDRSDCLGGWSAEGASDGSACWLTTFDTAALSSPSSGAQISFPYTFTWSSFVPMSCPAQASASASTSPPSRPETRRS